MKPVYKQVKTVAEFCPTCKERLSGNNSVVLPWECRCGVWEFVRREDGEFEYEIIPKEQGK